MWTHIWITNGETKSIVTSMTKEELAAQELALKEFFDHMDDLLSYRSYSLRIARDSERRLDSPDETEQKPNNTIENE